MAVKKWLRGIKSKVDGSVDGWLHGEERREQRQVMDEAQASMEEAIKPVQEFIEATMKEDLDVTPTTRDISRYFYIYQGAMEGKKKLMEHMGIWTQDADDPIIGEEEYTQKATAEGWKFLRGSVGLPLCDLNKPRPDAWRTPAPQPHSVPKSEGWDAEQKNG